MRLATCLRWVWYFLLLCCAPAALGQTVNEKVSTRPGVPVLVASEKCIVEPVKSSGTVLLKGGDGLMRLIYTPDAQLRPDAEIAFDLQTGPGFEADGLHCTNAVLKHYVVSLRDAQEVPEETVGTAFRVLVAALVIAVLLESAFELLFNWRLFQAYFVGKAWRTPIMFLISYLVAHNLKFDVLGPLFDTYSGLAKGTTQGKPLTTVLTAMILAGGSVGVNRIMTRLGIRSPFPKSEEERPTLNVTEAYVSVTVSAKGDNLAYAVNMSEEALDLTVPALLGVIGPVRSGVRQSLLFPSRWRIPRSGGIRVSVDKTYRFSVTDLRTNTLYDMAGNKLLSPTDAPRIRFAPRAFVDLVVVMT